MKTPARLLPALLPCTILVLSSFHAARADCVDYGIVPGIVGAVDTPGQSSRVVFQGTWAFVADGDAGVQVIDASDPGDPVLAATLDTPGGARDIAVQGTRVYVADGLAGIHIIDVSQPSSPAILSSLDTGNASALAIAGDFLYVADPAADQLQVILVMDPLLPRQVGFAASSGSAQVIVAGDRAHVVGGGSLEIFDLASPANPHLLGAWEQPDAPGMWVSRLTGAVLSGSRILLAEEWWVPGYETQESYLNTIDVANPASPSRTNRIRLEGGASGIAVAGTLAAVSSPANGIQFVDVSDPDAPLHIVTADVPGSATGVCMYGDHAVVAAGAAGLQFVEATGLRPTPLLAAPGIAPGSGIELVNGHACVWGAGSGAIRVVDVLDPAHPAVADVVIVPGAVRDAAAWGTRIYAATTAGLQCVEVSDPHDARLVGSAAIPFDAASVDAADGVLCVAGTSSTGGPEGLAVFDLSSPSAPALAAILEIPFGGRRVAMSGSIACVSGEHDGLYVIDVTTPAWPEVIGFDGAYVAGELLLRDGVLHAARYGELAVFDLSDPTHPVMAGALATSIVSFSTHGRSCTRVVRAPMRCSA